MLDSLLDLIAIRDSPEFNQMSNSVETKYRMFHIYRVLGEMGGERERAGERDKGREEEMQRRSEKTTDTGHAHTETYRDIQRKRQTGTDRGK